MLFKVHFQILTLIYIYLTIIDLWWPQRSTFLESMIFWIIIWIYFEKIVSLSMFSKFDLYMTFGDLWWPFLNVVVVKLTTACILVNVIYIPDTSCYSSLNLLLARFRFSIVGRHPHMVLASYPVHEAARVREHTGVLWAINRLLVLPQNLKVEHIDMRCFLETCLVTTLVHGEMSSEGVRLVPSVPFEVGHHWRSRVAVLEATRLWWVFVT